MSDLIVSEAGGGFMGIGPAQYLQMLEAWKGSLSARAVAYAGTSVGAIDMALMACGYTARDVYNLHCENGAGIFGKRNWKWKLIKAGPQYDDSYVNKLLQGKLGTITMDKTAKPLYICAWDCVSRSLKVFGPKDVGVPVWYAVRCSMAAPTYFAPMPGYAVKDGVFSMVGGGRYLDGGMSANDPAAVGCAAAVRDGVVKDPRVLQLVTSGDTPDGGTVDAEWSAITVLRKEVLPALTAGNSADVDLILGSWIGQANVFRVSPQSPDYDLDACDHSSDVVRIWTTQFNADKDRLLAWI